jgi:hypothetical protein
VFFVDIVTVSVFTPPVVTVKDGSDAVVLNAAPGL